MVDEGSARDGGLSHCLFLVSAPKNVYITAQVEINSSDYFPTSASTSRLHFLFPTGLFSNYSFSCTFEKAPGNPSYSGLISILVSGYQDAVQLSGAYATRQTS
jgi:hypothetical protein